MPYNLLKTYNDHLELNSLNSNQRKQSLLGVFSRDFIENSSLYFLGKEVLPTTTNDGILPMETLFTHLTTRIFFSDKNTKSRTFDYHRSCRLHWVRFHLDQRKKDKILHFSVKEPDGIRTYIYDKVEKYVIVLEPLRNRSAYYLLTAYFVSGKDSQRDKIIKKYRRKLNELY